MAALGDVVHGVTEVPVGHEVRPYRMRCASEKATTGVAMPGGDADSELTWRKVEEAGGSAGH
jgi:hypothetical protein